MRINCPLRSQQRATECYGGYSSTNTQDNVRFISKIFATAVPRAGLHLHCIARVDGVANWFPAIGWRYRGFPQYESEGEQQHGYRGNSPISNSPSTPYTISASCVTAKGIPGKTVIMHHFLHLGWWCWSNRVAAASNMFGKKNCERKYLDSENGKKKNTI